MFILPKCYFLCQFLKYRTKEPRHDKTNKMGVRPAKTQISLGIRPVWSESSLCASWVAKDTSFLHADSEDSDQTGRMPRLIWVFAGCTLSLLVLSCRGSSIRYVDGKHKKEWVCALILFGFILIWKCCIIVNKFKIQAYVRYYELCMCDRMLFNTCCLWYLLSDFGCKINNLKRTSWSLSK